MKLSAQQKKILGDSFLFRGVYMGDIMPLIERGAVLATFQKGQVIYSPDHYQKCLAIILSGGARVVGGGGDNPPLLNRLSPGDVFGVAAIFSEGGRYVASILATARCRVLFIGDALLLDIMQADFTLVRNYLAFLSDRIAFLNGKIAGFTGGSAKERLLAFLKENAVEGEDGGLYLRLDMTMGELARALDIARPSLYRAMDALTRDGIICRKDKTITIERLPAP